MEYSSALVHLDLQALFFLYRYRHVARRQTRQGRQALPRLHARRSRGRAALAQAAPTSALRRPAGLTVRGDGGGAQIVGVADTGIDWDNCFFWESAYSQVDRQIRAVRGGSPPPPSLLSPPPYPAPPRTSLHAHHHRRKRYPSPDTTPGLRAPPPSHSRKSTQTNALGPFRLLQAPPPP